MAFTQWPFDFQPDGVTAQEVTEDQLRHTLALASQSGVVPESGTGGGPALRVTALDDSSGVEITSGYAQVNGYTVHNDATEEVSAPANSASQPRRYWVVLQLDRSARTITPQILEGSASSSPSLPDLTRDETVWELPLAEFRRSGGGGSISNMIERRVFVNASGSVRAHSGARPPLPVAGDRIYESDTGREMYYHDGLWRTAADPRYPSEWRALNLASFISNRGPGRTPAWRWRVPGQVELRGSLERADGDPLNDNQVVARVHEEAYPGRAVYVPAATQQTGSGNTCRIFVASVNVISWQPGQIAARFADGHEPDWLYLDGIFYDVD